MLIWAITAFTCLPALQFNIVNKGKAAPNLIATLNIGAFNIGNAVGAWAGGIVTGNGLRLVSVPLAASALAVMALLIMLLYFGKYDETESDAISG